MDGIAPEASTYDDIILVLIDSKKPTQWFSCNIMPIPKAGNLNEVDNYRSI